VKPDKNLIPFASTLRPEVIPEIIVEKSEKADQKNISVQCSLLMPEEVKIQIVDPELGFSGDYMGNLLERMNKPDPRDLSYLSRERSSIKKWDSKPILDSSKT